MTLSSLQEPENTETHVHLDAQVPGEACEMYQFHRNPSTVGKCCSKGRPTLE